jgi:hypothetical protein
MQTLKPLRLSVFAIGEWLLVLLATVFLAVLRSQYSDAI